MIWVCSPLSYYGGVLGALLLTSLVFLSISKPAGGLKLGNDMNERWILFFILIAILNLVAFFFFAFVRLRAC